MACSASAVLRSLCSAYGVLVECCLAYGMLGECYHASCVEASSVAVNGKLVAASEGRRRQKLASMVQRFFAAGVLYPPTSANCWASRVIPRETMYILRCYVQPDCHMAGISLLFQRP